MKNEDNKKHMIFSTDTDQYSYKDYSEWCDECDVDCIYEEGSTEFYDWVHEQINQNIECDRENIKYSQYANRDYMITGTFELWNGHPTIRPIYIHGLNEAIEKCVNGRDIWDYDVFINDDEDFITVHAKHHDGTNVFEIHLLTREGAEAWEKAYNEYEYGDADFPELKPEYFEKIEFNKIF